MRISIQFFREPLQPPTLWKLFIVWIAMVLSVSLTAAGVAWYQQEPPRYGIAFGVALGGAIGLAIQYFMRRSEPRKEDTAPHS